MAHFHIYADESGKYETPNCEYTSMCGYLGHASEWNKFSEDWMNCRLRWAAPPIHMGKIYHADEHPEWLRLQNKWGIEWDELRERMLLEFAKIVARSNLVCIAAVVDAAYFRALPDSAFKRTNLGPIEMSFHRLVTMGIARTEVIDRHSSIGLVLDDDAASYARYYQYLLALKSMNPKVKERIASLCFVNDEAYPGVQAADMVSYDARSYMWAKKSNPDMEVPNRLKFLSNSNMHIPDFYGPKALDALNAGGGYGE
ncbi:MAG: DUF3800 domain-containing protein [Acidobacteriia bacterium]|nr:DUF3800 domain-containing protein [Terriglobia bacterium]